ncbi:MAG: hypothetical protein KDH92_10075 [Chloroflexi bacterium]|nr:hypothetical protein [Chloroflexota bacterium]
MDRVTPTRRATLTAGLLAGFLATGLAVTITMLNDVGWDSLHAAFPYLAWMFVLGGVFVGLPAGFLAGWLQIRWARRLPSRGLGRLLGWAALLALVSVSVFALESLLVGVPPAHLLDGRALGLDASLMPRLLGLFVGFGSGTAYLVESVARMAGGDVRPASIDAGPDRSEGAGEVETTPVPTRSRSRRPSPGPIGSAAAFVLVPILALLLFKAYQRRPEPRVDLREEAFDAIQLGMSLEEVEGVVGGKGIPSAPVEGDRRFYSWRDRDFETNGFRFTVVFEDGVAIKKDRTIPAGEFDLATIAPQLRDPEASVRMGAYRQLAGNRPDLGGSDTAEAVAAGLLDPDPNVRLAASWSLRTISQNSDAHRNLGKTLPYDWPADDVLRSATLRAIEDPNPEVAGTAIRTLFLLYEPDAEIREALVRRYASAGETDLKPELLIAIGHHGYDDAEVVALLERARADPDPAVRGFAAVATARCKVPGARALLEQMRREETGPEVLESLDFALSLLE